MKKITIILIAFMYVTFANAQEFKSVKKDLLKSNLFSTHKTYKKVRELIYVQDSLKQFNYDAGTSEWIPQSQEKYLERFPNGRPKFLETSNYISDEWVKSQRVQLFYDYSWDGIFIENLDSYVANFWDANTLSWRSDTAFYFNFTKYYDIDGFGFFENVLEDKLIFKNWDVATNQYTGGEKYDFTLLSDSLYSSILMFGYNSASNEFDLTVKNQYTYNNFDGKNKITLLETKAWDGASFVNSAQTNFAYIDNNMVQSIKQTWNSTTELWENSEKITKTYDAANLVASEITYDWDGSAWEKNTKKEFINDPSNEKILTKSSYNWNSTTNQWEGFEKLEYTYNVDNYLWFYHEFNGNC